MSYIVLWLQISFVCLIRLIYVTFQLLYHEGAPYYHVYGGVIHVYTCPWW
jgi:hypothetical protein